MSNNRRKFSTKLQDNDELLPEAGNILAFETQPTSEFAPKLTNRHAAIKLLGVSEELIVIGVLDRIWSRIPTLQEAERCGLLREHRFQWNDKLSVFAINRKWWSPTQLKNLQFIGAVKVTDDEAHVAELAMSFAPGTTIAPPVAANHAAEGEWRWANDREAYLAESEEENKKVDQAQAAAKKRYRERLSQLTYEKLLSETPLQRWTGASPFPPDDFTSTARSKLHNATRELRELGPKPRKAAVRKILKSLVEWFNEADREADNVIETEEREDVCAAVEELAFVAKQRSLVEEIDDWREW